MGPKKSIWLIWVWAFTEISKLWPNIETCMHVYARCVRVPARIGPKFFFWLVYARNFGQKTNPHISCKWSRIFMKLGTMLGEDPLSWHIFLNKISWKLNIYICIKYIYDLCTERYDKHSNNLWCCVVAFLSQFIVSWMSVPPSTGDIIIITRGYCFNNHATSKQNANECS